MWVLGTEGEAKKPFDDGVLTSLLAVVLCGGCVVWGCKAICMVVVACFGLIQDNHRKRGGIVNYEWHCRGTGGMLSLMKSSVYGFYGWSLDVCVRRIKGAREKRGKMCSTNSIAVPLTALQHIPMHI